MPAAAPLSSTTPPTPIIRVGRLDTLDRVRRELIRLYRDARSGRLDPHSAARLASVLAIAARLIEGAGIEERWLRWRRPPRPSGYEISHLRRLQAPGAWAHRGQPCPPATAPGAPGRRVRRPGGEHGTRSGRGFRRFGDLAMQVVMAHAQHGIVPEIEAIRRRLMSPAELREADRAARESRARYEAMSVAELDAEIKRCSPTRRPSPRREEVGHCDRR